MSKVQAHGLGTGQARRGEVMASITVDGLSVDVPDEQAEFLGHFPWHITPAGYVVATVPPPVGTYVPKG